MKSTANASRYNEFYIKQLNYVENKFHKINHEISKREESLNEMNKRRNTMSMLSKGSKRILNNRDSCKRSQITHLETPSHVNLELYKLDKQSLPSNIDCVTDTSKVHDRLYQEREVLDIKRSIMKKEHNINSYRNLCINKSFANTLFEAENGFRNLNLNSMLKTPQQSRSKHIKMASLVNQSLSDRLEDLKATEEKLHRQNKPKKSPKIITQKLYNDALTRRKSKEAERKFINKAPKSEFANKKSNNCLIQKLIDEFNDACHDCSVQNQKFEFDFLNIFEIMKKLGFIRQKENISQTEINSDKALFMDFWQFLDTHKKETITRDLLLSFCLAIENYDLKDVVKHKEVAKAYYRNYQSASKSSSPEENKNEINCDDIQITTNVIEPPKAYLTKAQVNHFHQVFIQFARNRSLHFKMFKKDKYKKRDTYDDHLREKPSLSKNSLKLANKIKSQYGGSTTATYCEIRKQSMDKKKLQKSEDQIGGQAKAKAILQQKQKKKEKNRELLKQWHKKEIQNNPQIQPFKPKVFEVATVLDEIPEETSNSLTKQKSPQRGSDESHDNSEQIPLLSIDVNFGLDKHDKITVFQNDDLKKLANDFKTRHGLSKSLEDKLYGMLSEQVKSIM